jgi:hypothetical protein
VLGLLAVTLTARTLAAAAARGRLARPRTPLHAGLAAALGICALPFGTALAADYPAALLRPKKHAPGEQRVPDLLGRTDPHIAAARAAHDDAALRHYLFVHARPEFVHVDASVAARTGLTPARLAAHGYRPVLRQGAGGDFVHRSALTAPERLTELRAWARTTATRLADGAATSPVRLASGDHEPRATVGQSADFRPDERTCPR